MDDRVKEIRTGAARAMPTAWLRRKIRYIVTASPSKHPSIMGMRAEKLEIYRAVLAEREPS